MKKLNKMNAIIFDMDGTLFTSEPILHSAYLEAVTEFEKTFSRSLKKPSLEDILRHVGYPASVIFKNLFPDITDQEREKLNTLALNALLNKIEYNDQLIYDGIEPLLKKIYLHNKKMFMASNGRRRYIQKIIDAFQMNEYFDPFLTIEDPATPTKSAIVEYYITNYNLDKETTLMVGDRKSDIIAAQDNGIPFAGVTWGHGAKDEISEADFIYEKVSDFTIDLLGSD